MPVDTNLVQDELKSLGYEPFVFETNAVGGANSTVVAFNYQIEAGTHAGCTVTVGVSFQEAGYPEYPPHWIHVSPPLPDQHGGGTEYSDSKGQHWLAMSRPPGPMWDRLPDKHMRFFISEHLRRIWRDT